MAEGGLHRNSYTLAVAAVWGKGGARSTASIVESSSSAMVGGREHLRAAGGEGGGVAGRRWLRT